ncbi:hypothetical protein EVAR_3433_1 [Eumeta japonica]|uniref:Uncharacterized protein n=1 Tax=Eumeta variegata TaxID=151549 RepID=A0A4C1SUT2_EUMVA|nr:hypothetical protein EVAR_3433_1 [Eumeta japonica]
MLLATRRKSDGDPSFISGVPVATAGTTRPRPPLRPRRAAARPRALCDKASRVPARMGVRIPNGKLNYVIPNSIQNDGCLTVLCKSRLHLVGIASSAARQMFVVTSSRAARSGWSAKAARTAYPRKESESIEDFIRLGLRKLPIAKDVRPPTQRPAPADRPPPPAPRPNYY